MGRGGGASSPPCLPRRNGGRLAAPGLRNSRWRNPRNRRPEIPMNPVVWQPRREIPRGRFADAFYPWIDAPHTEVSPAFRGGSCSGSKVVGDGLTGHGEFRRPGSRPGAGAVRTPSLGRPICPRAFVGFRVMGRLLCGVRFPEPVHFGGRRLPSGIARETPVIDESFGAQSE
jgi:hypothetical protein